MTMYITTQGFNVLAAEYNHLKSVERPKVVNEVAEAAALGDRSENAEYIYGKRRLRQIDSRMRYLDKVFSELEVINPATPRGEKVFFGATVTLYDEDQDAETTYQIVGPMDTLDDIHISYLSPVGKALLGRSLDDTITVRTPKEVRHLTISEIKYI